MGKHEGVRKATWVVPGVAAKQRTQARSCSACPRAPPRGVALWAQTSLVNSASSIPPLSITSVPEADVQSRLVQCQRWETLGVLAVGVAHQFNHLLTAIIGHTDGVESLLTADHPARAELTLLRTTAHRAAGLTRRVLNFSHTAEARGKTVELVALIQEALPLLRASVSRCVEIRSDIAVGTATVSAEPNEILQLFFNLGTNAGQALRGTGTIGVSLSRTAAGAAPLVDVGQLGPGPHICLSISDTGNGIDPRIREQIFEPFFTTKPRGVGTGLGLAVVRDIVLRHGGAIAVRSAPGEGTAIQVYLPEVPSAGPALKPAVTSLPTTTLPAPRIAIIDDEDVVLRLTEQALSFSGYHATALTSPEECLARMEREPGVFDLIISDQRMPTMSGTELLRAVRARGGLTPVLVTSGSVTPNAASEFRAAGYARFLPKPFTLEDLLSAVQTLLDEVRVQ
jgi:signal transduction histidine kinase/ActR/RegA family two-component response regulator